MNYVGTINLKHICEGKKIGKRAYSYLDKYRDFPRKNSSLFCVPFTMRKHVIINQYLLFILHRTINIRAT